jgi:hypothetical protein
MQNDDLISRKSLLEKTKTLYSNGDVHLEGLTTAWIESEPAVENAEIVVHCKDCKYCSDYGTKTVGYPLPYCECPHRHAYVTPDGFCDRARHKKVSE